MKWVRIISGFYGFRDEKGRIALKAAGSEPFEVADAEAERLVDRGIAVTVEPEPEPDAHADPQPAAGAIPSGDNVGADTIRPIAGQDGKTKKNKKRGGVPLTPNTESLTPESGARVQELGTRGSVSLTPSAQFLTPDCGEPVV